jgi:hypothetical protein
MSIQAERSQVGPEVEGTPVFISPQGVPIRSPRINRTFAETTVSAADGQTVVLGGLITKSTSTTERRVPYIADIPILGDLFRYDNTAEQRTELLIVMTPRIVRSDEDIAMIRQIESSRMSWVMSDVIKLHGVLDLRTRRDEWADHETMTIFPEGQLPPEMIEGQVLPEGAMPAEPVPPPIDGDVSQSSESNGWLAFPRLWKKKPTSPAGDTPRPVVETPAASGDVQQAAYRTEGGAAASTEPVRLPSVSP